MLVALLSTLLLAPVVPPAAPPAPAVAAAITRLAARPLWEGFDPGAAPVAIFDGAQTWLFRHPAPPEGFAPAPSVAGAFVRGGRLPEVTANSSESIGGVVSATLVLPETPRPADEIAATAIHELFHVFERAHHPDWAANEVTLLRYPVADAEALALRRLEHEALRRALLATDPAPWAAAALALRTERFGRIPADAAAYERATEENEGLAQYVEDLALGRRAGRLGAGEFAPEEIRQRGYATGQALALLLDRLDPGWRGKLTPGATLDGLLGAALPDGERAAFTPGERAEALRRAREDVAALERERARLLRGFLARKGWSLVVVAKEGEPLFPERFDPWNLRLLTASQVLHGRALKAANADGSVETFGRDAVTEAAGPDPLFTGLRRLRITGLSAAPRVTRSSGGGVDVTADGVSVRFRKARVRREGSLIEVRVGEAR